MSLRDITDTIEKALTAAGLDTRTGVSKTALDTIRRALAGARSAQHPNGPPPQGSDTAPIDVVEAETHWVDDDAAVAPHVPPPAAAQPGRFLPFEFTSALGTRAYKLYVPSSYEHATPMPLVVMLHGCQQDPDDFARGTRMNEVAEEAGCLVVYPAQSRKANGSACWRWFEAEQQHRAGAEPSIVAGIVRQVGQDYRVDERKVFVAGLSAGAAMAVILGQTYPDVFTAVAAHSGLPHGAAQDVGSAFAAMRSGAAPFPPVMPAASEGNAASAASARRAVPTIVFHGQADATVVPANGAAIAGQAVARLTAERGALTQETDERMANGRRCTRTRHLDSDGVAVVEEWSVQDAGHAWFGGSSTGSFASPAGPDASREILRFFSLHAQREVAPAG